MSDKKKHIQNTREKLQAMEDSLVRVSPGDIQTLAIALERASNVEEIQSIQRAWDFMVAGRKQLRDLQVAEIRDLRALLSGLEDHSLNQS